MATTLTVAALSESAVNFAPAPADTGAGNSFNNQGGDVMLYLENTHETDSSTAIIEVQTPSKSVEDFGTLTKSDISVVLAAGAKKILGPFPKGAYNDAGNLVQITYTGTGTVNVKAFKSTGLRKV